MTNLFKNNFLQNLKQWQKQLFAIVATFTMLSLIVGGWLIATNQQLRDSLSGKTTNTSTTSTDDTAKTSEFLQKFNESLKNFNPDNVIYKEINLEDLPIYPKVWVTKYFTEQEQANALISGESADPDGDGLSNKQEYLYGSDPRVSDSLCQNRIDKSTQCSGRNDKQNVDANISPLTGLTLDTPKKFQIKQQDYAFISQLKDSLTQAANEGVDFPTLYQEARLINLKGDIQNVDVKSVDNNRQTVLDYISVRLKVLEGFTTNDALGSFSKIYSFTKPEQFDTLINQFQSMRSDLTSASVPQKYVDSHKAYIFLFDKLLDLLNYRKSIVISQTITDEYKKISKQKAVAMAWAYQNLNEELLKISPDDE